MYPNCYDCVFCANDGAYPVCMMFGESHPVSCPRYVSRRSDANRIKFLSVTEDGATYRALVDRYVTIQDALAYTPAKPKAKPNIPVCISCGSTLRIERKGSRKYCAKCGCYLPEIVYMGDSMEDGIIDAIL